MNSRKKLMGTIAVGAALLMVPVAQAQRADDRPGPHGAAIITRGAGAVVIRPDDRAGLRGPDYAALARSRPDDRAGLRGSSSAPVQLAAATKSDGFDWIDALIGGVGGIATALLILGGTFLLLNQRNRTRTA